MFNPNGFGGDSEYGYGRNDNGTEMSADDYYAENPSVVDDRYDANYQAVEQEEADEIRDLYPGEYEPTSTHEAIRDARRSIEEASAALDKIEQEMQELNKALSAKQMAAPKAETLDTKGEKRAENIDAEKIASEQHYVDSQGMVHTTLEEALGSKIG